MRADFFSRNFTQLLNNNTQTLSQSFVEVYLKMTIFRFFNQDSLHFSAFQHRAERAASEVSRVFLKPF